MLWSFPQWLYNSVKKYNFDFLMTIPLQIMKVEKVKAEFPCNNWVYEK